MGLNKLKVTLQEKPVEMKNSSTEGNAQNMGKEKQMRKDYIMKCQSHLSHN